MPAVQVWIADKDYSKYVDFRSISIEDSIKVKSDSLVAEITIPPGAIEEPRAGNKIEVRRWLDEDWDYSARRPKPGCEENYELEFAGQIITRTKEWVAPPEWFKHSIEAADWTRWFDRYLINEYVEPGHSPAWIVSYHIIYKYCRDFDLIWDWDASIANMGEFIWEWQEPSVCLDELCEKALLQWYIDFDKCLHLVKSENFFAPLPDGTLYLDTDIVNYGDFVLTEDISGLKNVIYLKDFERKSELVNETFTAVLSREFYRLSNPMYKVPYERKDEISNYVTVEAVNLATGQVEWKFDLYYDNIDSQMVSPHGHPRTAFVNFDRSIIRLAQPLPEGFALRVKYYGVWNQPEKFLDPTSIMEVAEIEGSDGVYEFVLSAPNIQTETGQELIPLVERALVRYARPVLKATFYSYTPGWQAGQRLRVFSKYWGLDQDFYITNVTKTVSTDQKIKYEITCCSNMYGD